MKKLNDMRSENEKKKDKSIEKLLKKIKPKKDIEVNIYKLEKLCNDGDVVIVPGRVLGSGEITKKLTVYALGFSKPAKEKIILAGGKALKLKELKEKVKGMKIIK
ncbi:MAG: 50S ribosomal protein L18e [Candidatus Aenigmatarchaeota archaeon]